MVSPPRSKLEAAGHAGEPNVIAGASSNRMRVGMYSGLLGLSGMVW